MKVRVDDFAEAELLGEIVRPAEQVHGRGFALEQFFHPGEQHAVRIDKVHLLRREVLLKRLNGRIVTARLVADRHRNSGEIGRILNF